MLNLGSKFLYVDVFVIVIILLIMLKILSDRGMMDVKRPPQKPVSTEQNSP